MKLNIKLKNKNSCDGCPIYRLEEVYESGYCPILNDKIEFKLDGTFYGESIRSKKCIKKFGN